jgi:hypothetical protein
MEYEPGRPTSRMKVDIDPKKLCARVPFRAPVRSAKQRNRGRYASTQVGQSSRHTFHSRKPSTIHKSPPRDSIRVQITARPPGDTVSPMPERRPVSNTLVDLPVEKE